MKKSAMLAIGVVGLALGAALLGLGQGRSGQPRFRFIYNTQPMSAEERASLSKPPWELRVEDLNPGTRIQYGLSPSSASGAPWLIYFPGNDKSQLQTGARVLLAIHEDHPANLIVLSYRGFSGNSGRPTVEEIQSDNFSLVTKLMAAHEIKPDRLHLIGFSIGGYFSGHCAAELAKRGQAPASLTLLAPGYDLVMVRPSIFQRFDPGDHYQMASFLPLVQGRSLVLQGSADDAFAGPLQGKAAAEALERGGKGSYQEIPGEGHSTILDNDQVLRLAREFIWR